MLIHISQHAKHASSLYQSCYGIQYTVECHTVTVMYRRPAKERSSTSMSIAKTPRLFQSLRVRVGSGTKSLAMSKGAYDLQVSVVVCLAKRCEYEAPLCTAAPCMSVSRDRSRLQAGDGLCMKRRYTSRGTSLRPARHLAACDKSADR